jgi:cbb3-type cytochrome oxidase maturation protein
MDILYLLIPFSVVLVLLIVLVFAWALHSGQMDDLEHEGRRILDEPSAGPLAQASPTEPAPKDLNPKEQTPAVPMAAKPR